MIGDAGHPTTPMDARRALASTVAQCILGQLHRPYPCSAVQVLHDATDLQLPVERFPVFYGSFDWHSCVHSHWALVRLLGCDMLEAPLAQRVEEALARSFDPKALAREAASWARLPEHTERPYGLTWLLALDAELGTPKMLQAHPAWREALGSLVAVVLPRVRRWVDTCGLPVRSGVHSDTAWSLAMAWDWATSAGDDGLAEAVATRARSLYFWDVHAPCAYEPSGETFMSAILNEAACMARVLDPSSFDGWMRGFLPQVFEVGERPMDGEGSPLLPNIERPWDGVNYLGVHEVALPLARCIAARDVACALEDGAARAYLSSQAARWERQGLAGLFLDGYLADHWVGSFAVAAVVGAH